MNICKNCGRETKNKKYCSRECQKQFKFKRRRKKQSQLEKYLSTRLRNDFPWVVIEECNRNVLGDLEIDIFLPQFNIGIEVNGKMHYEFVEYFHHTYKNFLRQLERDRLKKIKCQQMGIRLIEVPNLKSFSKKYAEELYCILRNNLICLLNLKNNINQDYEYLSSLI